MARWKLRGLLCVICYLTSVSAQTWDDPYFEPPPSGPPGNVVFDTLNPETRTVYISMDEVNVPDVMIATMVYTGTETPVLGATSIQIGLEAQKNDVNNKWDLVLTKPLDKETTTGVFSISVTAGGQSGQIRLSVRDINDNPPYFDLITFTECRVKEGVTGDTQCKFIIRDPDENFRDNGILKAESPDLVLRLEPDFKTDYIEATLFVDSPLDYEASRVHRISLIAKVSESDPEELIGTANIILEVDDVADTNPYWIKRPPSVFNTDEESDTPNSFDFEATDGDYGINAKISYELVGDNIPDQITIKESSSGMGMTLEVGKIDRESLLENTISITLKAYEENDNTAVISEDVLIIIDDINDNSPVVTLNVPEVAINEESLSTIDVVITVDDPDLGSGGSYSISLEDDSGFGWASAFNIVPNTGYNTQTFTLTIRDPSKLDFEDANWKAITLKIKAVETENPEHTSFAELKINLLDINDETPEFTQESYEIPLREDVEIGTPILTLEAMDNDIGDTITYKLVTRNRAVNLDEVTGVLTVAGTFNYEIQSEIILQAEARDLENHVAFTTITIVLEDINDTPPIFDVIDGDIDDLPEGSPVGTQVTSTIQVSDPDSNAALELSIDWDTTRATNRGVPVASAAFVGCMEITPIPDPNPPEIGTSILGNITVLDSTLIDYETFDLLYLVIVVTDTNTEDGNRESKATITITIENVNDAKPEFVENTINSKKTISENQINNETLIGYIIAIDPDNLGDIKYSLRPEDGTPDGLVYIDEDNGELRAVADINNPIDAELLTELKYTVIADDGFISPTEARIVIEVEDRNDMVPEITQITNDIEISEEPNSGDLIMTIQATDGDISEWYSKLYYELDATQSNFLILERYIEVNPTNGEMRVKDLGGGGFLDPDNPEVGRQMTVTVRVTDNFPPTSSRPVDTNTRTMAFTLKLIDVNDNAPEFDFYPLKTVTEDEKQDNILYPEIQGIDADEPNTIYSILTYEITNVRELSGIILDDTIFKLSEKTTEGSVDILAAKDLSGYFGEYEITIEACDSDPIEKQCSSVDVRIDITDVNDNDPVFVFPTSGQKIRIRKEQQVGNTLIQENGDPLPAIEARDDDSGVNGLMDFSIMEVSPGFEDYFDLVPSGDGKRAILQLKQQFNAETPPPIDMTILATDRGIPEALDGTVTFKIYVIDQFEQPPVFSEFFESINFRENDALLTHAIPEATDPNNINVEDPEDFQDINFFLVEGDEETFSISDGKIILLKPLDREELDVHSLRIVATNADTPPIEEGLPEQYYTLNITVTDVADFDPYFEVDLYPGGIAPSDSSGVEVMRITAVDEDSRLIDPLTYSIDEDSMTTSDESLSNVVDPFILDPIEGSLKTNFKPQSNMKGYFEFKVIVTDSQPKSNTTTVKVYIINDSNRVVFKFQNNIEYVNSERDYIATVFSENLGYPCSIDDVSATDRSLGSSRNTTYSAVRTHFIDTVANEPVPGKEIEKLAVNPQTWNKMSLDMGLRDLILFDIVLTDAPANENLAAILTIVLIAVSVVLGSLVLVLFIAFVVKTRSLKRRLEALSNTKFGSQESGLNRIGMNVPNTNKHTVEGSNPVWNEDVPQYDNQSVSSGDSDLIGVEDNPEFHYGKDQTEFRGSQEGGYYSGSDLQATGRHEEAGHELSTEL